MDRGRGRFKTDIVGRAKGRLDRTHRRHQQIHASHDTQGRRMVYLQWSFVLLRSGCVLPPRIKNAALVLLDGSPMIHLDESMSIVGDELVRTREDGAIETLTAREAHFHERVPVSCADHRSHLHFHECSPGNGPFRGVRGGPRCLSPCLDGRVRGPAGAAKWSSPGAACKKCAVF
jgi:hypothetical protein